MSSSIAVAGSAESGRARTGSAAGDPATGASPLTKIFFVVPAALYVVLFFGYPVVKNLMMSFQAYTTKTFFTGEAPWVGLANYVTVSPVPLFAPALLNTVVFTVGSIIGQFVIGLAFAVFFYRRFPLSEFLRAMLLLPWLLPLIVSSATWRSILDQDSGILNTTLSASSAFQAIPWLTRPVGRALRGRHRQHLDRHSRST